MIRRKALVLGASVAATMIAGAVGCLSDPREGEEVTTIDTCDPAKLSTDATNPQATLKAYLTSTDLLVEKAKAVATELRDACNALDTELGAATNTGTTPEALIAACNPIAARVEALSKKDPALAAHPPGTPYWAELRGAPKCTTNRQVLVDCVSSCAGACDATKCDPAGIAGKCEGECNGTCTTTGTDVPCTGKCVGLAPIPGPPATCIGECEGICINGAWGAECGGACGTLFGGLCGGTCTGTCDGQPINPQPPPDPDAGPPGPLPPPPPANADGNCKGFCVGQCSSNSNGACNGVPCFTYLPTPPPPVAPAPYRGYCLGVCGGMCKSAGGTPTTGTCTGECTASTKQCAGTCRGQCTGNVTSPTCETTLKCNQNQECENACQARVQLTTTCEDSSVIEVYAVSDPTFAAALKKHGPRLAKAVSQILSLRVAYGFISNRAYGDFVAIGLKGDFARACVSRGEKTVNEADSYIRAILAADPTIRKL